MGNHPHRQQWNFIANHRREIIGNYFEGAEGEAETISDKTQNNHVAGNTFSNISKGWLTARLGGGGTYENNTFINTFGIRVGNTDDTIPDHPGLTIRNNYLEGPNEKILLPGYQTDATITQNTVYVGAGSYAGEDYTTGKYPIEYNNTTNGTLTNNLFVINDASYGAVQAQSLGGISPTGVGSNNLAYNLAGGTIFYSGTPSQYSERSSPMPIRISRAMRTAFINPILPVLAARLGAADMSAPPCAMTMSARPG